MNTKILLTCLLILVLSTPIWAQSLGLGLGIDNIRWQGVATGGNFLLLSDGGKITLNAGGSLKCNAC
jgi:hypothetical protein